jgi:hypothetical protein
VKSKKRRKPSAARIGKPIKSKPRRATTRPVAARGAEPDSVGTGIERIEGEPWIRLADGRALARWSKDDEIRYNQGNRQTEKLLFFRRAFDFLSDNRVRGDYHEFGCHRVRTLRMALTEARRHQLDDMKFWAFDSFVGLPEPTSAPSVDIWKRGALTTSEETLLDLVRRHGVYVDRVHTVPGFYADSLTPDLQRRFAAGEAPIALVTIDCDLYESAVPVFDFIDPLLQQGSVLYIDDLFAGYRGAPTEGVARAFLEYQQRSAWRFVRHLDVGWWGRSYIAYKASAGIDGVL